MSYYVVDIESDGPVIGKNSMVCFAAVKMDEEGRFNASFYGQTSPISKEFEDEALAISGFSREEHEKFPKPEKTIVDYCKWVKKTNTKGRPILLSDNNQYDGAWIEWYCLNYWNGRPFGWSSRRIGDLFAGFYNNMYYRWKKHRKTRHSHDPLDDALGNAEALLYLKEQGLKINFE